MNFWRRKRRELCEEIDAHLRMDEGDRLARGENPLHAAQSARRELGNTTLIRETARDLWGWRWLENLMQDTRYALRMLRKSPCFTTVAVITLGLGIGANAAIFSVVNAVLLEPLSYANPGQLVFLPEANPEQGISGSGMSYPTLTELRDHNRAFRAVAGFASHFLTLTGRGEPSEERTVSVTSDFFAVFGTKPLLGRVLLPSDAPRGAPPVVVLGENLWRSRFGGDPNIIGSAVALDMRSFTVVGVMPAEFRSPFFNQTNLVWIPLVQDPLFAGWMTDPQQTHWMPVVARLDPGVSLAQAQAEMSTISARRAKEVPEEHGWVIQPVQTLQQAIVGDVQSPLLILLCAVGLVLVIACANIANLLLTRATSRSKEVAVRVALGASKWRIISQLLTESALLGLLAGVAGILLADWGVSGFTALLPAGLPRIHSIRVDGHVLGFALALSLAASLLFGLAPIFFAAGSDPQANLREGSRTGEGKSSRRLRTILAAAEVALAVVLLVGAGLLVRSFARLTSVSPGFDPDHVVKAMVSLPQFQYRSPQQWTEFSSALMTGLQSQPGLQDSACMAPVPIADGAIPMPFTIVGNPRLPAGSSNTADYVTASPHYFSIIGISLLRGRLFDANDIASTPPITVISAALAKRYFPNENPLGRQMTFGFPLNGSPVSRTIVGVVSDIRDVSLGQNPGPMMYVPFAQAPIYGCEVVVKSRLSPSAVVGAIRAQTHNIDKNLPVTDIASLPQVLSSSVAEPRFRALLLGLFSAMALALAAVGIFGVVSYSVSRRTHEIGIRMALGATPASVRRLVIREAAALVSWGLAAGIPAALVLTRFLSSLLFAVRPADPSTFIGVAILLMLVAAVAAYVPARRAMKVDPMIALRYE
ncbi:MAG TPA: ABC transporter permease [Candidatus Acidoferrales bacterium]|nr:ABC transporter permease [Candidatus Acidoferrales bacterium]